MKAMSEIFAVAKELMEIPDHIDSNFWPARQEYLYERNEPKHWAHICLLAAALTDNKVLKCRLLIEHVNGLRRIAGKWNIELIQGILAEIKKLVETIKGDMREHLLVLWAYHTSQVMHLAGKFGKAAEYHELSADIAKKAGNKRDELLSNFNAKVERLNEVLSENRALALVFREFMDSADSLLPILGESPEDRRWRKNVLCFKMLYGWLVADEKPNSDMIKTLKLLDIEIFHQAARLFEAIQLYCDKKYAEAEKLTWDLQREMKNAEWLSYVLLFQAFCLYRQAQTQRLEIAIFKITELAEKQYGCYLAKAIAENKLVL